MDFELFESNFLYHLKEEKENECMNDIDNNEEVIRSYLGHKKTKYCNKFIKKFNDIVVETKENFTLLEKVLIHDFFSFVLERFRKSDVLIKACAKGNEKAIRWLFTMEIDPCVKDDKGMTALMHAVKVPELVTIVSYLIDNDNAHNTLNMTDNNGETALFHSVENLSAFRILVDSNINVNHLNNDNDSILTYCCKNKIYDPIKFIANSKEVYFNIYNNDERTAAMYLAEEGRIKELEMMIKKNYVNFDFKNGANETVLSLLIKKYYEYYQKGDKDAIYPYLQIIKFLVEQDVNFNVTIDEDDNTPLMFFITMQDWYTVLFLVLKCKNIDLSIKNKQGINSSSLCSTVIRDAYYRGSGLNLKHLLNIIMHHKTFDLDYKDKYGNNLAMYYLLYSSYDVLNMLLKRSAKLISDVNNDKENLFIIINKLRYRDYIKPMIYTEGNNIHQKDCLGNTALYYAVEINDMYMADVIAYNRADINAKNNVGKSPLDLAMEKSNKEMIELLKRPIMPYKVLKMEKKGHRHSFFKKTKKSVQDPNTSVNIDKVNQYQLEYEDQMKARISKYEVPLGQNIFYYYFQQSAKALYKLINSKGRIKGEKEIEELAEVLVDMVCDGLLDMNVCDSGGGFDGGGGDCGDCGGGDGGDGGGGGD